MLRRLLIGLVFGLAIGVALAFGLVRLGEVAFAGGAGDAIAYLSAAVAGALTGTVAGKPIWAPGAKVEAGLKALFGALLGVGAMFALRRWAPGFQVDLTAVGGGGPAPVGELPMASLPIVAAGLGALFGLDNTDQPKSEANPRQRVATVAAKPSAKARVADPEATNEEPAARGAKR